MRAVGFMRAMVLAAVCAFLPLSAAGAAPVPYEVKIEGAGDDEVGGIIRASSDLVRLAGEAPESRLALERRAARDAGRLMQVLRAFGHFDARVERQLDFSASPARVVVAIDKGPAYPVARFMVTGTDGRPLPEELGIAPAAYDIAVGRPYRAGDVEATERKILAFLGEGARPFARVADKRIVVDRAARDVSITFAIDPGPQALFGTVVVEGLDRVSPDIVNEVLPFRGGDPVRNSTLTETRRLLYRTALFRSVEVSLDPPEADGRSTLHVRVEEAKARTIGGGVRYDSGEGPGANLFWEHRNLFGDRERFRAGLVFAARRRALDLRLTRPDFLALDQDLLVEGTASDETLEAYDSRRFSLAAGLERRFGIHSVRGGLSFEHARIVDAAGARTYDLVGLPTGIRRDTTDDPLDPTEGTRIDLSVVPYLDVRGRSGPFVPVLLGGSAYLRISDDPRLVLAVRGSVGAIPGPEAADIPADKRFYAGGGDSVRGFAYQRAGPLDAAGDPVGGRSIVTIGAEIRLRVTPEIGIVPFVDAGAIGREASPEIGGPYFVGAGLGLRYDTGVGPLRLDVATPVAGARGDDDPVQIYLSLGQAF